MASDVDPLADTVPPRHAIESDEEEDEYNPLAQPSPSKPVDVQLVGNVTAMPTAGLLIATGNIAKYWARGANLGEQVAAVMVDKIQVGLLFRPSWTQAVVLVSEATTRLPLWAMRPYARAVVDALQPENVALLDEYAVSEYIADARIAYLDAPLRYLTTDADAPLTSAAHLFAPPNLVRTTSAAFVALRAERACPAVLLLVPTPHVAPPAPRALAPSSFAHLEDAWMPALVRTAHAALFGLFGDQRTPPWTDPAPEKPSAAQARKRPADSELNMYI
ncbi:hypothetical protein GGX14DRAFT_665241 [Mycena pura]|uniref:Proteasome assembly chaperone 1 n=1 Tax=Mycena pura TaxID=153505 RepID=A0AAD6V0E9_9AGAR|nr:hypothetical protein GGX14DRAFT_665241 [Mycena pura]